MNADEIPTQEEMDAAREALRESWEKMSGEQQDELIASGWHPGPMESRIEQLPARAESAEARCARLQQALRELRAKVVPSLIAVKGHLETPYVDDERWTPWSRFVEPCLYRFDEVLDEALAGPDTPADSQPEETA